MASSKPQRKVFSSLEENQQPSKRPKKSPSDDLICPISLELPWDPVIAEDGRVYERESIEEHIGHVKKNSRDLRSPFTNDFMGSKLLPANWVQNHIDTLVESGVIGGELADKWNEKVEQKKLLEKAERGDADAMCTVGFNYQSGSDGFKEDLEAAFRWYKRAHGAKYAYGTVQVGLCYLNGLGVDRSVKRGMMYVSIAAGQGSDLAAYHLGMALADGRRGMIQDKEEAIHWLETALGDCEHKQLGLCFKRKAEDKFDELKA